MIKQMGGTRQSPKPNSSVASEAIELFTFLGGNNKEGLKLLKEMKEVQSHNERILLEANSAIREASVLQKEVEASQATLYKDTDTAKSILDKQSAGLDKRNLALDDKKRNDDAYLQTQNVSLTKRKNELEELDSSFKGRERALKDGQNQLEADFKALKKAQNANSADRLQLNERDARMKAAMGG